MLQVQRELRQRTAQVWPNVAHMMVPVDEGNFLAWLVATLGVQKAIEVGTFTGYSALMIAQVLYSVPQALAAQLRCAEL